MRVLAVYFQHSEAWTSSNEALMEAVVKQARTTTDHWLAACDANVDPKVFRRGLWFQKENACSLRRPKLEFPLVGPQAASLLKGRKIMSLLTTV